MYGATRLLRVSNFFQALLSLCSDELVSAKSALDLCINQMKNVLSSQQLPENASMETIGRAYHVTETFVQVNFTLSFHLIGSIISILQFVLVL